MMFKKEFKVINGTKGENKYNIYGMRADIKACTVTDPTYIRCQLNNFLMK